MRSISPRLGIPLLVFSLLILAFFVGLFTLQPGLSVAYLCLMPFVAIWLGRATVLYPRSKSRS